MPPYSHFSRRRLLALPLCALLFSAGLARQQPAQQPPPPVRPEEPDEVVRVTTEIVQTDVTVVDGDGKFVDGLKAGDFELKVDGKPQAIQFFERVAAGGLDEDAQLAAARGGGGGGRGGPGPAGAAVPLDRGRAIIFFLDDFHLSPASIPRTRKMLTRFIDAQMRQNDRVMIVAASNQLGFLQQLTDDKAVLRAAVARLSASRQQSVSDHERPTMNVVQAIAVEEGNSSVLEFYIDQTIKDNPAFSAGSPESQRIQAANHVRRRAVSLIQTAASAAGRTLESLRGLIKTSAQFPGRKLFYFVSDGFEVETRRSNTLDLIRRVTDAALRSGVVVYTLDPRGLGAQLADLPSAAIDSPADTSGRLAGAGLSTATATQAPLRTIADETGGRAILNTDNFEAGITRALKETAVYYLLAWRPEGEGNRGGKFRKLEVGVKGRANLTVLVQRGFYASPPEDAGRRSEKRAGGAAPATAGATAAPGATAQAAGRKELIAALFSPVPRSAVPTTVTLNFVKTLETDVLLSVSMSVEIDATPAAPAAGGKPQADRVEFLGQIYDAQGKVVYNFQRVITISPQADETVTPVLPTHNFSLTFQAPVKPGLYQVRAAARDQKNGRTGSDSQWIEIPDLSNGSFSLSSLLLGNRPAPDGKGDAAQTPQLIIEPDRRFARDSRVRFLVYAYNAALNAGQPDVAVQVQVFRDDQPVVTAPLSRVTTEGLAEFSRIPYIAEFPLTNLPAGRYTLQLTAIDRVAKASAAQRIKFAID